MTRKEKQKLWKENHKEHIREYQKEWCRNHKEVVSERNKKAYLKRKYKEIFG